MARDLSRPHDHRRGDQLQLHRRRSARRARPAARPLMTSDLGGNTVLAVDGLSVGFATRNGPRPRRQRRLVRAAPGRDAGAGRRVGLRQERHQPRHHAPAAAAAALHHRTAPSGCADAAGRSRDLLALPEAEMRTVRGNEIAMIFQEPMTSLNPVHTVGDQIAEAIGFHETLTPEGRARAGGRAARSRRHPGAAQAPVDLSAPALRRHAPARHDRHGAGLRPQGADRRRADHRARRHRAGADPRAAEGSAEQDRHGDDLHHPQSRRRRRDRRPGHGDVCEPHRRAGRRRRPSSSSR